MWTPSDRVDRASLRPAAARLREAAGGGIAMLDRCAGAHEPGGAGHCTRDAGRVHARERPLVAGMRIGRRRACRMRPMPGPSTPPGRVSARRARRASVATRTTPRLRRADLRHAESRHAWVNLPSRAVAMRAYHVHSRMRAAPARCFCGPALPSHRRGAVPAPPDRARDMPSTRQRPVSSVPPGVSRRARGGRASGAPARSMRASRVRPARRHHVRRC